MTHISFKEALATPKQPGEGVHVELLRASNMAHKEGIDKDKALADLTAAYPDRPAKELSDAVEKAYAKAYVKKQPYKRKRKIHVEPAEPVQQEVTWKDWLLALFKPGEFVVVAPAVVVDGKTIPNEAKRRSVERDQLIADLTAEGGPAAAFGGDKCMGVYVCANPMQKGERKKTKATAYRHALIEWDTISEAKQWGIIKMLRLPAASIIGSGNKSVHVLVPVNAEDAEDYEHKVGRLHEILSEYGTQDSANKDVCRYTRFPGAFRDGKEQKLHLVNSTPPDFDAWLNEAVFLKATAETERFTLAGLEAYQPDPENYLLGQGWVRKGAGTIVIGGTGIGKSVLAMQMAMHAAAGKDIFPELTQHDFSGGISVPRAMKVCVCQAENDADVLKRDVLSIARNTGLPQDVVNANLVIFKHIGATPEKFAEWLDLVLERERPELLLVDPYSPYIGNADINDSDAFAKWKGLVQPLLDHYGVGLLLVVHTPKPNAARAGWNPYEKVYMAMGTSLLPNWCRCSCELSVLDADTNRFLLGFSKNAERTGVQQFGGSARKFVIEHSGNRHEPFWRVSDDQDTEPAPTDKQKQVVQAIKAHPDWTNVQIAEETHTSESYVRKIKKEAGLGQKPEAK